MNHLEDKYGWLSAPQVGSNTVRIPPARLLSLTRADCAQAYVSLKNETDKVIVFERAGLLFVFNLHPTESFTEYRVGVEAAGTYQIVLSSDDKAFGGFDNVDTSVKLTTTAMEWNGRKNWLQVGARGSQGSTSRANNFFGRFTSRPGRRSCSRKSRCDA